MIAPIIRLDNCQMHVSTAVAHAPAGPHLHLPSRNTRSSIRKRRSQYDGASATHSTAMSPTSYYPPSQHVGEQSHSTPRKCPAFQDHIATIAFVVTTPCSTGRSPPAMQHPRWCLYWNEGVARLAIYGDDGNSVHGSVLQR